MRVVTASLDYIDIDAYAGCIAYAELLQIQGDEAIAVSTAPLNESISKTVLSWQAPLETEFIPSKNDTFTLIDVSDPSCVDKIVDVDMVEEIIDHRPVSEHQWGGGMKTKVHIEFIGAACTLVYERWIKANLIEEMSVVSARLMVCGILDNTLNLRAQITTQRDIDAYNKLLTKAELPQDWTERYFTECREAILSNIVVAIKNDTKILSFRSFEKPICFGQLVVWDVKSIIDQYNEVLQSTLSAVRAEWFMNLVSIDEGKSYFITDNQLVQNWLTKLLGVEFNGLVATADRLWLRKEIIKQDLGSN